MTSTRAGRRHHKARMKQRAVRIGKAWGRDPEHSRRQGDHFSACSCWMCGNPRRFLGEVTMQEKRAGPE